MKRGSTLRNVIIGGIYFLTLPLWLPFGVFAAPIYVGANYGGSADALARLPGVREGGGVLTGVATFGYLLVLLVILALTLPGGGPAPDAEQQAIADGGGSAGAGATATTVPQTATPTATATASPTPTGTPTPTVTPAPTPALYPDLRVRIQYAGQWQGSLSLTGDGSSASRTIEGSGARTLDVEDTLQIIAVNAQKQDDSSRELTVQIRRDDEVVAESSTTAEYGVAQVSQSFF